MPAETDRWNWGAFLLNWIWGIGNNTFVALLTLVPIVGLIMPFVLGAKGSKWAWRNAHWDSVDHFKRVQRAWAKWAMVLYCVAIISLVPIFGGLFYIMLGVSKLEASTEVANLLGTPITTGSVTTGKIDTVGADGQASLSFSVSGPKGSGTVDLTATRKNGVWSLESLKLRVDGQDGLIDLLHPTRANIGGYRSSARLGGAAQKQFGPRGQVRT